MLLTVFTNTDTSEREPTLNDVPAFLDVHDEYDDYRIRVSFTARVENDELWTVIATLTAGEAEALAGRLRDALLAHAEDRLAQHFEEAT